MKKRKIVLDDKAKIASVILELDEKKSEALKKAYEQVTRVGNRICFPFVAKRVTTSSQVIFHVNIITFLCRITVLVKHK